MARGVRDTARTDWGVATTGVAGPSGGSPETPVGDGVHRRRRRRSRGTNESGLTVSRYEDDGTRREIKSAIATEASATWRPPYWSSKLFRCVRTVTP